VLIFKYPLIREKTKWGADAQNAEKNSKRITKLKNQASQKFCRALKAYLLAVRFTKFLCPKTNLNRWLMSGLLDRASILLACSEWDVFKSAFAGDGHRAQEGYTAYLSSGELPEEVLNYIDALPKNEETYM